MLAFVVARRLGPPGAAGVAGGALAVVALLLATSFGRQAAVGYSEGLLVALVLGAVLAHLDARPRLAVGLGLVALLLRPEAAPLLAAYVLVCGREDRRLVVVGLGGIVAAAALWTGPEWWGSGEPLRAATRATHHGTEAVRDAGGVGRVALTLLPAWALAGALAGAALRRPLARPLLAGAAFWIAEVALMAQLGFAGNARYALPAAALLAVSGGAAWGALLAALDVRMARARPAPAAGFVVSRDALVAGALTLAVLAGAGTFAADARERGPRWRHLGHAVAHQRWIRAELPAALARAGGRRGLARCGDGRVITRKLQRPMVAWYLDVPARRVGSRAGARGTVLRVQQRWRGNYGPATGYRDWPVGDAGPWEILRTGCGRVAS